MRGPGLVSSLLAFILLFSTVTASSWWSPLGLENALARRQNNNDNNNDSTSSNTDEPTSSSSTRPTRTSSNSNSDESSAATSSGSFNSEDNSSSATGSNTRSGNSTRTSGSSRSSTLVDPRLPAGGISLITPAAISGSQYYKVGDFVTFEWNYTSLSNTPAAIDVFASCSLNQATYTIAQNMSVEETGKVVWDTGDDAQNTDPFPVATYTLYIHDSARDPTQVASAGDLGAFNQFRFGVYTGQPYTPLNEFKCSTCSAAWSLHEQQALGVLGVTSVVTVLAFTWFVNGVGLLG
jgi:hypothetical protein